MNKFFASIAPVLLASLFFSCGELEEPVVIEEVPEKPGLETPDVQTYTMTVVAGKSGDETRALAIDGATLKATWAEGEKVKVYNLTKMRDIQGELVAQSSGATTTLKGQLQGEIAEDDILTLKFLSPSYDNQNGTLEYIAEHCDYAEADVTVASVKDGQISVSGTATFKNKQAIVKFTLHGIDGTTPVSAKSLQVTVGAQVLNVKLSQAQSEIYVAIPAVENRNVRLQAVDASDKNLAYQRAGVSFADGKYYAITVKMSNAVIVYTKEELKAAVANGVYIILGADITESEHLKIGQSVPQEVTLDLNGHTLKRDLSSATSDGHVIEVYEKGTLTVTDSATGGTITGGYANNGGGICNYGTLNFQGGTISECKTAYSEGCMGGGIKNNRGGIVTMSGGTIAHCESGDCGGIYNGEGATLIVTGGTILDCKSGAGGGGIVNYGTATLSGLLLDSNTAGTRGGNIWNKGSLTIDNCVIQGGEAKIEGGGFYLQGGGETTLTNTKVQSNESPDGGGFFVAPSAKLTLGNGSEVALNVSSDHGGGGIVNYGAVTLKDDVVISENSCETNGGGIWSEGTLNMEGRIMINGNSDGIEYEDDMWVPGNRDDDVYLKAGHKINVTGALTGGSESIGVRMQTPGIFTSGYAANDSETDDFFPSGTINGMGLENGEGKMYYRYYEASWDKAAGKAVYTVKDIPSDKQVDNVCGAKYASGGGLEGNTYWFVADGTGAPSHGLTCDGAEVHLILCDDAELKINGCLFVNGGTTLHIHSQSYGGAMGKLVADPRDNSGENSYNPGIGGRGDQDKTTGKIIIHGGDITAYGGKYAAGIGGGSDGDSDFSDYSCDSIKIYGGAITATGGEYGPGIGSAYRSTGGTIDIYGGSISGEGGNRAAGIGGGHRSDYYRVTIFNCSSLQGKGGASGAGIGCGMGAESDSGSGGGGTIIIHNGESIVAIGGTSGAGIGSGYLQKIPETIIIKGGTITATGGAIAAGIGTGAQKRNSTALNYSRVDGGKIIIEGGKVKAQGGDGIFEGGFNDAGGGAGIGTGGYADSGGSVTISGGIVEAYAGKKASAVTTSGAGIGGGYKCNGATVTITGGTVTANGYKKAIGAGDGADDDCSLSLSDGISVKGGSSEGNATVASTDQRNDFCRKAWAKIWPGN